MKLIRLYIEDHLLLHNLDLRFDRAGRLDEKESYRLDFLVGVNGSGKSTLLRTLVEIFSSLQTGEGAEYRYMLEYELDKVGQPVKVTIDKQLDPNNAYWQIKTTVYPLGQNKIEYSQPVLDQQYMPDHIAVYTTGSEQEWEKQLSQSEGMIFHSVTTIDEAADHTDRFVHEIPGHLSQGISQDRTEKAPPFLLIRGSRLNAITLCGLLHYLSEPETGTLKPLASVLDAVGIEAVTGFSLRFRFYERLSDLSLYETLVKLEPQPLIIHQASDRLLVFDLTKDDATDVAKGILEQTGGAFELFQKLGILQENDQTGAPTLQEINIFLQRKEPEQVEEDGEVDTLIPGVFLLDWLSDGERAFLGRMALLAMLDMQDSLIILDEPEVHFNDYWKRHIIQFFDQLAKGHTNQILLTTHSTIVMSDVAANQLFLFTKDEFGHTQVSDTHSPLFGADPSYVMTNLLGTGNPSGAYSRSYLEDALERNDRDELQKLLDLVGPGYWRFRIIDRLEGDDAISAKNP